ncbi:MAG: replication protein RepA [Terracidiphilus sp.]
MGSELTSIRSILGLNPISAPDKLLPASRFKPGGACRHLHTGPILPKGVGLSERQAAGARQAHLLLPFVQAIPTESALDAGALGFMAKFLVQTTLPHSEQTGTQYVRTDGNVTLRISDVGGTGLPYGSYPRLILIWMTTEAVRSWNRELELGSSLSRFMAQLGLQATGGHWGTIPRFRDQMQRLVGAAISTRWSREADGQSHLGGENLLVADRFHLWWTPQKLPTETRAKSTVTLSVNFFDQLVAAPVPLDLRAIRALKKSPLALDLYAWATRRVSYLLRPTLISWESVRRSFGAGYADTPQGRSCFRVKAIEAFRRIVMVYPDLKIESHENGLLLRPSGPHIPKALR